MKDDNPSRGKDNSMPDSKSALTLTPEEYRSLMMARIDRSLKESGVVLPDETRERIAALLPLPDAADVRVGDEVLKSSKTVGDARALLETVKKRALASSGNRAKIYRPTNRAREVDDPKSTTERVLNLIVHSGVCNLGDLVKGTHRPKRAIYTSLWQLKKDGLIDSEPAPANGAKG